MSEPRFTINADSLCPLKKQRIGKVTGTLVLVSNKGWIPVDDEIWEQLVEFKERTDYELFQHIQEKTENEN